jgi:TetR/AcrR family transcriptional regulator, transcriptional repressor for nem operon
MHIHTIRSVFFSFFSLWVSMASANPFFSATDTSARRSDRTRQTLLESALTEIHSVGFQAASLSRIVAGAGVSKGALYHHFPNKLALGYAVVDEPLTDYVIKTFVEPYRQNADPIECMRNIGNNERDRMLEQGVTLGCPLVNLSQEMSPVDEGFRTRIDSLLALWRNNLAEALKVGQENGYVRTDIDPIAEATLMTATRQGAVALAKAAQSLNLLENGMTAFMEYLDRLRPDDWVDDKASD